jgi:hypothetical protein
MERIPFTYLSTFVGVADPTVLPVTFDSSPLGLSGKCHNFVCVSFFAAGLFCSHLLVSSGSRCCRSLVSYSGSFSLLPAPVTLGSVVRRSCHAPYWVCCIRFMHFIKPA